MRPTAKEIFKRSRVKGPRITRLLRVLIENYGQWVRMEMLGRVSGTRCVSSYVRNLRKRGLLIANKQDARLTADRTRMSRNSQYKLHGLAHET